MTTEYAIAFLDDDGGIGMVDYRYRYWTKEGAQRRRDILLDQVRPHTKIVRRPVGPWEEA